MLTCFAVNHPADEQMLPSDDFNLLQAIADEADVKFEPGFAGSSYLEVPANDVDKDAVLARLEQNSIRFSVVTRIAY